MNLLGVRWMKKRYLRYDAGEVPREDRSQEPEARSQKPVERQRLSRFVWLLATGYFLPPPDFF
jgi:hypothetical protein